MGLRSHVNDTVDAVTVVKDTVVVVTSRCSSSSSSRKSSNSSGSGCAQWLRGGVRNCITISSGSSSRCYCDTVMHTFETQDAAATVEVRGYTKFTRRSQSSLASTVRAQNRREQGNYGHGVTR